MIIEMRPKKDNPYTVEFYAAGQLIENISAVKVFNHAGRITAKAVVTAVEQGKSGAPAPNEEDWSTDPSRQNFPDTGDATVAFGRPKKSSSKKNNKKREDAQ